MNHDTDQIVAVRMIVVPNEDRRYKFFVDYLPYSDEYWLLVDKLGRTGLRMLEFKDSIMVPVYAGDVFSRYRQYKHLCQQRAGNAENFYDAI